VKSDTVGPGEYDIVKPIGATKKGPKWHTESNKKNLKEGLLSTVTPGPGAYNAEKVDIFPIYKYKASSVFVSKVDRDKLYKGAHS
jgi:hypothetical protein